MQQIKAEPQTYKDWTGNGELDITTTGKEDSMFSPFLRKPFKQAVAAGLIPASLSTIAGTWGTVAISQRRPQGVIHHSDRGCQPGNACADTMPHATDGAKQKRLRLLQRLLIFPSVRHALGE